MYQAHGTQLQRLVLGGYSSLCKYLQSWTEQDTEYLWQPQCWYGSYNEKVTLGFLGLTTESNDYNILHNKL